MTEKAKAAKESKEESNAPLWDPTRYQDLTDEEKELLIAIQTKGRELGGLMTKAQQDDGNSIAIDQRAMSEAIRNLQQAQMWAVRAVCKPGLF